MKPSSCKAKGRIHQQYVVKKILEYFPELQSDDVLSRGMGGQGEDLMLSPRARQLLPISIECKSNAKHAIYKHYKQATDNAKNYEPVLIVKQNHSDPLVVIDLDYFLGLMR